MLLKIYGFKCELKGEIGFDDFCSFLANDTGFSHENQLFRMVKIEPYWVGVLISIRDAKTWNELRRRQGRVLITPENLEEGSSVAELNFFLLHPETSRGLYQYYHRSTSLARFGGFLEQRWNTFKEIKLRSEAGPDPTENELKRLRSKYKTYGFGLCPVFRRPAFEEFVQRMTDIGTFEFEFETFDHPLSEFVALSSEAKAVKEKITFKPKRQRKVQEIIPAIIQAVRSGKLKTARVKGRDEEGTKADYRLKENIDTFSEYDYNDLLNDYRIDDQDLVGSIKSAPVVKELLKLAKTPAINDVLTNKGQK